MNQTCTDTPPPSLLIREAIKEDTEALWALEQRIFTIDRLSKRRIKFWLEASHRIFLVAECQQQVCGYILVLLHRGTRLARLYSIAVIPEYRNQGIATQLMQQAEDAAATRNRFFMRLEVARNNHPALSLYQQRGYKVFGEFADYYEDHQDALRMQKTVRTLSEAIPHRPTPWYQQTTDFTCGPASLMMAMASLNKQQRFDQATELAIWRQATTIFMTSGHGGCHPIGLALAASERHFKANVFLNIREPLFVNGVRNPAKKEIIRSVDRQFHKEAQTAGVSIHYRDVSQDDIARWIDQGAAIIILISTYRMDGRKAPHWVAVSGIDQSCLYVHDPDPEEGKQDAVDCQYMPIAREDFARMSSFGAEKLRACVVIEKTA